MIRARLRIRNQLLAIFAASPFVVVVSRLHCRSRLWGLCKNVCFDLAVVVSRIDVRSTAELLLWKNWIFSCFHRRGPLFIDWKWKWYLDSSRIAEIFPFGVPGHRHTSKVKRDGNRRNIFFYLRILEDRFLSSSIWFYERIVNGIYGDGCLRWEKLIESRNEWVSPRFSVE